MPEAKQVLLVDTWGHGGLSAFCRNLAAGLSRLGCVVDVYCFSKDWAFEDAIRSVSRATFKPPASFISVIACGGYDVVHASTCAVGYPFSVPARASRAGFEGRLVVTAHYLAETELPLSLIDCVTAVSSPVAAALSRRNAVDIRVVQNGIDVEHFSPGEAVDRTPSTDKPILAWIGRAADPYAKDVDGFLYLAASDQTGEYDYWIVDGSPEVSPTMCRLSEWFSRHRLRYERGVSYDQLPDFYRRVAASGGAVVSTSVQEASPLSLLEAWACRCVTVVPEVPGFEHAIEARASVHYRRADGIDGLQRAVRVATEPGGQRRLGEAGFDLARTRYDRDTMSRAYLSLYSDGCGVPLCKQTPTRRLLSKLWVAGDRARQIIRTR
jgi:glycosyltransferase involved in cell wall biosynthesis